MPLWETCDSGLHKNALIKAATGTNLTWWRPPQGRCSSAMTCNSSAIGAVSRIPRSLPALRQASPQTCPAWLPRTMRSMACVNADFTYGAARDVAVCPGGEEVDHRIPSKSAAFSFWQLDRQMPCLSLSKVDEVQARNARSTPCTLRRGRVSGQDRLIMSVGIVLAPCCGVPMAVRPALRGKPDASSGGQVGSRARAATAAKKTALAMITKRCQIVR